MNKKGYFFIADGLIASIVLITGLVIIGSIFASEPIFKPPYNIGQDLLNVMASTNISSLSIDYPPVTRDMFNDDKIEDNSSSVLQQIAKFYHQYCETGEQLHLQYANRTAHKIMNSIVPSPWYAELNITGHPMCGAHDRIYTNYPIVSQTASNQEKAKTIMVTQKLVFGNTGYSNLYGPYVATLKIWR